jgi:hypothetical protein
VGQDFDRVAIALTPGGKEYIVLETQLIVDFGQGQGPKGGVLTVEDGWVAVRGPGEARLSAGTEEQGGNFSPRLTLVDDQNHDAVEITAYPDPPGSQHLAKVYLEGNSASLRMRGAGGNEHTLLDGRNANLWLGGKAADGDILLFRSGESDNRDTANAAIQLDGQASAVRMRDSKGNEHTLLEGQSANLWLGGQAADGDIVLFRSGEPNNRDTANASIHLNGDEGDIILRNADCAEDFDVAETEESEPGTLMVFDEEGVLRQSRRPYDKRVAGVVSGGGDCRPGLVLDRHPLRPNRRPVALMGRVFCKADARFSPIEIGDLLTTSHTPGHAMKAADPLKAFGAVIGKALKPLDEGDGLIPILVSLQ